MVDLNHLKEKIESESNFISKVLDRIPSTYWQESKGSDEFVDNTVASGSNFVQLTKKTGRAETFEELQQRLEDMKAKKKQGPRELAAKQKKVKRIKGNKRKNVEDRNSQRKQLMLEKHSTKQSSENGNVDYASDQKPSKFTSNGKPSKPVFNSQGKMVFSKFDFSEVDALKHDKKKKKEAKDPRKILEKLKEKKETLRKLKEEGQEAKVFEIKQKEAWCNALKKAEGVKIKDDPELLKKSLQRQEAKKKASAKKWEARQHGQNKAMQERQEKRMTNIKARKDAKKDKKKAKAIKKGRLVPGF